MKKLGALVLGISIFAGALSGSYPNRAEAASPVQILLDGYPLSFSGDPVVIKGTTMVPFRSISEALGIPVTWNQAQKTITAVKGEGDAAVRVKLTLNNPTATVNGSSVKLAVAPKSQNGNTLIPLSFFSQQFGAKVNWNQANQTVSITSPKEKMYTLGFYAISAFSEVSRVQSLDSVAFGWSRIDESGVFSTSTKPFRWPQAAGDVTPDSLVTDAVNSGTTPYLMVYSSDVKGELTKIVENPESRKKAIADIITAATGTPFEGIMLDFEGLGLTTDKASTRAAFNSFVKELGAEAKGAGLKLGLALHPLNSSYQGYDYKALGNIADEIVIMAYDYRTGTGFSEEGGKQPEPVSKVDEAIRLAIKETSKDKLILGLNMDNENANSVSLLTGLAKRYDLKGIALWRLGIIKEDEWKSLEQSIEFKQ
ncbi:glycosyl hydrolase family 18 (putative chitinase) [Fontibacillus phaseoli]|uniref:Glycosyl hydrolase family 18 (Putative chitinase) n=1 Tax=Fontibacillus phaseoli TaxID=1416533 RepID=A0A369B1X0_9BACL|nr:stalk domain-containing protein [Fontibacillus phaseoli]RCX14407.1 glycosyl hydrolase family 18 (putative chitinase) [Fontibacillus phaseoli]